MSKQDGEGVGSVGGVVPPTRRTRRDGLCPRCGRPPTRCLCGSREPASHGKSRARVQRKTHRGETRTAIWGLSLPEAELRGLAGELARACGTTSSVENGIIELQGDHQDVVARALEGRGYGVELS